jgi:hypothetical protein
VRLWASTLATEIGADSLVITMSPAFSTVWMKIGRLRELTSKPPVLRGKDITMSIVRRGAMMYEGRESPPVEIEISLFCWRIRMLSLAKDD